MSSSNLIIDPTLTSLGSMELLAQLPYPIGIKNQDSVYVGANQPLADLCGLAKVSDIIGRMDCNLPTRASELHEVFVTQDRETLCGPKQINLDVSIYAGNQFQAFLSTKIKVTDNEQQDFVFFTMVPLPMRAIAAAFNEINSMENGKLQSLLGSYSVRNPRVTTANQTEFKLTQRLSECLFYLLRGHSMKEIARYLKISNRTVEEHLVRLKNLFNCNTKSQLIEKAIDAGYTQVIPPSLLQMIN